MLLPIWVVSERGVGSLTSFTSSPTRLCAMKMMGRLESFPWSYVNFEHGINLIILHLKCSASLQSVSSMPSPGPLNSEKIGFQPRQNHNRTALLEGSGNLEAESLQATL